MRDEDLIALAVRELESFGLWAVNAADVYHEEADVRARAATQPPAPRRLAY